ncbi:acyl-CoA desaturase [Porphyrobacter sp. AAP82]|uniref:acyl-CoA desaturase n=1 Tax=Porphyrobacter sp. AAP82 TaxID=1248917 RepID=UPI0002F24A74|nr:acyl-CoA desaturase [Porphyrobacter sp. AAP82]
MMEPVIRVDGTGADPCAGRVRIDWPKALWNAAMIAGTLAALALATWQAFALFLGLTYATLLVGHSVGMHRMMIHRTFKAQPWLARTLIYIGTLVGVSGPSGIICIHDARDWAQREPLCHDFFAHRAGFWLDLAWNLFCRFDLDRPPRITIEPAIAADPFYRLLDATWRWQQVPLGLLLYALGGWAFVLWGICARVFASTAGHWSVTYFCHNPGPGRWIVKGAGLQAANLTAPGLGLLTYGECWHNNHHAFPESARIGLEPGQTDPGWWVIRGLERLGWVHAVGAPRPQSARDDLAERGGAQSSAIGSLMS